MASHGAIPLVFFAADEVSRADDQGLSSWLLAMLRMFNVKPGEAPVPAVDLRGAR